MVYTNIWLQKRIRRGKEKSRNKEEDFKQAKLILEENLRAEQNKKVLKIQNKTNTKQESKEIREEIANKELEKVFRKSKKDRKSKKYKLY